MTEHDAAPALHHHLIEALYLDTLLLADEARDYCEGRGQKDAAALDPVTGVVLACESLRLTTRLMQVMAWLLNRRAVAAGELDGSEPCCRLDPVADTDRAVLAGLPTTAGVLIAESEALYRRAATLDASVVATGLPVSPARALQQRLVLGLRG